MQMTVPDTQHDIPQHADPLPGFVVAVKDRSLQLFVLVNLLFTTNIALVNSTLPLYFTTVMSIQSASVATTTLTTVANLFTWRYVGVGAVLQLPIVQMLHAVLRVRVLMVSMLLWSIGFVVVWKTAIVPSLKSASMIVAFCLLSIATAVYKSFASAIVSELAPVSLRSIYLAMSYQC
jgi:hypothetical protein